MNSERKQRLLKQLINSDAGKSLKIMLDGIEAGKAAVDELFKELGRKQTGDWGIINDGCLSLERAYKELERWKKATP